MGKPLSRQNPVVVKSYSTLGNFTGLALYETLACAYQWYGDNDEKLQYVRPVRKLYGNFGYWPPQ
jgi:hypothetical protein